MFNFFYHDIGILYVIYDYNLEKLQSGLIRIKMMELVTTSAKLCEQTYRTLCRMLTLHSINIIYKCLGIPWVVNICKVWQVFITQWRSSLQILLFICINPLHLLRQKVERLRVAGSRQLEPWAHNGGWSCVCWCQSQLGACSHFDHFVKREALLHFDFSCSSVRFCLLKMVKPCPHAMKTACRCSEDNFLLLKI